MSISDNLQPVAWGVTMPVIIITLLSSLLRFYSRLYISKQFGMDDWFMVAATVGLPFAAVFNARRLILCPLSR